MTKKEDIEKKKKEKKLNKREKWQRIQGCWKDKIGRWEFESVKFFRRFIQKWKFHSVNLLFIQFSLLQFLEICKDWTNTQTIHKNIIEKKELYVFIRIFLKQNERKCFFDSESIVKKTKGETKKKKKWRVEEMKKNFFCKGNNRKKLKKNNSWKIIAFFGVKLIDSYRIWW